MKTQLLRYIIFTLFICFIGCKGYAQTFALNTNGVYAGTTLYTGQNDLVLYGISVTPTTNTTFSNYKMTFSTPWPSGPLGVYSGLELWVSTSGSKASATQVTTASFGQSGSNLVVTSGTGSITFNAGQTYTFYVVADFSYNYGTIPTTGDFKLATIYSDFPVVTWTNNTANTSETYTYINANFSISDNNYVANGITPGALTYGQTDIVLFSFGLTGQGNTTVTGINVPSSASMSQYFKNSTAKIYRSTDQYFANAVPITGSLNFNTGFVGVQISGLTQTFSAATPNTYYYFIVADLTQSISYTTPKTVKYNFTPSQSSSAIVTSSASYNGFTTTLGQTFKILAVYDWIGGSNSWTDKNNFHPMNSGAAVSSLPDGNVVVNIGRIAYTNPPVIGTTTVGGLTFGNTNANPSLTLTGTLTLNNSVIIQSGTNVTVGGTGTLLIKENFSNGIGSTFTSTSNTTEFGGTTQNITNSNTTSASVQFKNLTFSGGGTKTMLGAGSFNVGSTGTVTMAGSTTLAAAGKLTLKSDINGTAGVAIIPAGAQITGNVTVERWFTGGQLSNRGWRLMSSPVANGSGTYNFSSLQTNLYITGALGGGFDVSPANNATVLLYDTPNKKLISLPSITTGVSVGSGFYFYFRGDKITTLGKLAKNGANYATPETNVVGLQTGTLNQQGITYTLSNAGSGFNLVGNPYASTISMPSGGGAVGNSAPYTGTTGFVYTYTPGANSVSPAVSTVNIASGQGFYVKSNNATSSIAFTESLKTSAQVIGSNLLLGKPVGTEQPLITIKMVQDSANYDIAHVRFLDTYKNEYDENEDADDINGSGQNVFLSAMTIDNHAVAVASQPLDKKKTSVFLTVNDNFSGLYTIQKMNLSGIPEVYDVWLMDHFKNDSLDLRANDTYKFNLDKANPLTFGSTRFEIVLRKKALPPYELVSFNGQKTGTDVLLKWNTVNEYDYTSFELQRSTDGTNFEAVRNIQSSSQGSYNFKDIYSSNNTATIYYRLKQVDINDMVYYSNIVIITPAKGNGTFAVFPNPATNTIQFTLDQTIKSSSVRLNIFNAMGLLMKSNVFTASTGQQDVSNLTPGNYTIEVTDLNSKKAVLTGKFIKL